MRIFRIALLLGAGILPGMAMPGFAAMLIDENEARLPNAAPPFGDKAITRGPTVRVLAPASSALASPFDMKVRFEPHGGAAIEPTSVKVIYLKSPTIDLTERVKPYITASGIDMGKAEVPPGQHPIRIEVEDTAGRRGSAVLTLTIGK